MNDLKTIAEKFDQKAEAIEQFFIEKSKGLLPPLYLSCDIRSSGHKLAVIDTNLFPAGFNNLCSAYSKIASNSIKYYFNKYYSSTRKIIILIEENTRNRYYLENIYHLQELFQAAGLELRLAYLGEKIPDPSLEINLAGKILRLEKLEVVAGFPQTQDFIADLIVSNNDFSQGLPPLLQGIEDKIIPAPSLGWFQRKKSQHFAILQELTQDFSAAIDLDPWLLSCFFNYSETIELSEKSGLETLAQAVQDVLNKIKMKYEKYGIEDPPYVFVKDNSGTYGMGLIEIFQAEEILQLNRRLRNKLLSAKGGKSTSSVLIQEGIPTADFYSDYPIEPVVYMVGFDVIGGFFRMNPEKSATSSLNSKGMIFSCLCLHKLNEPHEEHYLNCAEKSHLIRLASVVARLAALAAALEFEQIKTVGR